MWILELYSSFQGVTNYYYYYFKKGGGISFLKIYTPLAHFYLELCSIFDILNYKKNSKLYFLEVKNSCASLENEKWERYFKTNQTGGGEQNPFTTFILID